jgi:hypothetical protein
MVAVDQLGKVRALAPLFDAIVALCISLHAGYGRVSAAREARYIRNTDRAHSVKHLTATIPSPDRPRATDREDPCNLGRGHVTSCT